MMVLVPWSISILFKQTAKCQDDLISKAKEEKKKKKVLLSLENSACSKKKKNMKHGEAEWVKVMATKGKK